MVSVQTLNAAAISWHASPLRERRTRPREPGTAAKFRETVIGPGDSRVTLLKNMSDSPSPPDRVPPNPLANPPAPEAKTRPSWFPGWIWLLPIAAVGAVAYLGIGAWTRNGPTVHVIFTSAPGVKVSDTKVRFQGQEVGEVEAVTIQKDLKHTDVEISLRSQLAGHLGPGTRFWIAGGNVSLNDLSALKTLISGPYIGIEPIDGKPTHGFTGLQTKPELTGPEAGRRYRLHETKLGNISAGSPVLHLGVNVGRVLSTSMAPNGDGVDVEAFVSAPYDKLVHAGTRFWDASAVQLSSGGGGPRIQLASLPALVSGAVAFETPDSVKDTPVAAAEAAFKLYQGESDAENAPTASALAYQAVFTNPSDTLPSGAPVTLAGKRIGEVGRSQLAYDGADGKLTLHADLMLEPSLMPMENVSGSPRMRMDAMLGRLIAQGLRAGLETSPPVIGGRQVALTFAANPPQASLGTGSDPMIPTTSSGGVDALVAQASQAVAKVNAMPFEQIGDNLRQTTERLAQLSTSPQVTEALRRINAAVANLERVSATMSNDLPHALVQVTQAVQSAKQLVGPNEEVGNQPQTSSVPATLYEVRQAARSIRELADTLDRNPQALLTGREATR
jgi:paraquat-inducible protein B